MYLGNGPPRRRMGSNPIRVLIYLVLIAAGLYLITVRPEDIPQLGKPTPTPTRTAASFIADADNLYLEGQLDDAIAIYEQAIRSDPIIVENYIPLVRMLVFQGRIEEALDWADTALFVDPDHAMAHAVRGFALDWQSALLFDQGLDKDANDLLIEALGEASRAVESDPTSPEAHAYKAEILFDLGNYNEADEAIDDALAITADNMEVQRVAGYLAENRGYREDAIEYYRAAIRIHPNLALLHSAVGRTYITIPDIPLARTSLKRAVELDPTQAENFYFLGYAEFSIGNLDVATDYFKQALELDPEMAKAHCQLGLIYYQKRNWEGAIPELEIGVELYGDQVSYRNAFCYFTLGLSYFYQERCEDAYPLFDIVLAVLPENLPALDGIQLCREAEAQDYSPEPTTGPESP